VTVMLADSVVVANFVVLFVPVHMKVFDGISHFWDSSSNTKP
jgi:hypothetical protein